MEKRIWTYNHRALVHFGPGAIIRLTELAGEYGNDTRIMLVCGRGAMKSTGILDRVLGLLGRSRTFLFDRVPPNPDAALVSEGAALYRREKCGLIVGLGGGSALDTAKAVGMMCHNDGDISDYMMQKRQFVQKCEPIITINTTAGTGSEVNAAFVITVPEARNKYALSAPAAWPKHAIVDPELTLGLPPDQTASTGLDALSHAFESLWCARHQPVSDVNAFEAISIIMKCLPRAVDRGRDLELRTQVSLAALLAGFALCTTGTAMAHGMSYPITARYGLPHGFACNFILPEVLEFNFPTLSRERKQRVLEALSVVDESQAVLKLRSFSQKLGTPKTLREINLGKEDVPELVQGTNPFNLKNNVRPVTDSDLKKIWSSKIA